MEISRLSDLRPRFVWDIVDDAFDLYRERFGQLCALSAVVHIPTHLTYMVLLVSRAEYLPGTPTSDERQGVALLLWMPLYIVASVLATGATAAVVEDFLTGRRELKSVGAAYRRVGPRFGRLTGAALLTGLATLIGACALLIGALVPALGFTFAAACIQIEGRGVQGALRRSYDLVKGAPGKVIGLVFLVGFITTVLTVAVESLTELAFLFVQFGGDTVERQAQEAVLQEALSGVTTMLLTPLLSIATTLLYYDFRVRREGLDIVAAAEETGYTLAPDPFGDVSSEQVVRESRRNISRSGRKRP